MDSPSEFSLSKDDIKQPASDPLQAVDVQDEEEEAAEEADEEADEEELDAGSKTGFNALLHVCDNAQAMQEPEVDEDNAYGPVGSLF